MRSLCVPFPPRAGIDYHPPYLQLKCREPEKVAEEARKRGLRIYRGKQHITVTDGIYSARIYLEVSVSEPRFTAFFITLCTPQLR